MNSRTDLSLPGRFRSYTPPVAHLYVGLPTTNQLRDFTITLPNVRVRVGCRLWFECEALAGTTSYQPGVYSIGTPGSPMLWVGETVRGRKGGRYPVRNIVGTIGAPVPLTSDSYLWGRAFDAEFVSGDADGAADVAMSGKLAITGSGSDVLGLQVYLQATYQALVPLTDAEWETFRSRCSISYGG